MFSLKTYLFLCLKMTSIYFLYYRHDINIVNFREHVLSMAADSDFKYAEEFEVFLHFYNTKQFCTSIFDL